MKLVAVSQRVDEHPGRNERRDALDQRLSAWLLGVGFMPVPVPNGLGMDSNGIRAWLEVVRPEAVVLSGGNDIGEFQERDATERQLLTWAQNNGTPVLGICRGMQMMAVFSGASLKPVQGHVRTRHSLIGKVTNEVGSFHNFSLSYCPAGFDVLAKSEDGEIEAIRHMNLPWEGWMWHPEREAEFADHDISRLRALFGGKLCN